MKLKLSAIKISTLILALFTTLFFLAFSIFIGAVGSVFVVLILGLLGYVISHVIGSDRSSAPNIFLLAYCASLIFSCLLYFSYSAKYGIPYYIGGSDDYKYEGDAILLAQSVSGYNAEMIAAAIDAPYHNSVGYVYFLSILVNVAEIFGGFHTIMPRVFNGFVLGLSVVLLQSITFHAGFSRNSSFKVSLVVALLPINLFVAAHTFRDTITAFFLLVLVWIALHIQATKVSIKQALFILGFGCVMAVLYTFRSFYILAPIAIMAVVIAGHFLRSIKPIFGFSIIFAVFTLTAIGIMYSGHPLVSQLTGAMQGYDEYVKESASGYSSLVFNAGYPVGVVLRVLYAGIYPVPTFGFTFEELALSFGTVFQAYMYPFLFLGFVSLFSNKVLWPIFACFIVVYLGFVFGTFTFRHLVAVIPFGAIFILAGYTSYSKYRRLIFGGVTFAFFCAGVGIAITSL